MKKLSLLLISASVAICSMAAVTVPFQNAPGRKQAATIVPKSVTLSAPALPEHLSDLPLVSEVPADATTERYSRSSIYFALDYYGQMYMMEDAGMIADVSYSGTTVYLKNPVAEYPCNGYLVGTLEGDEIVVNFPQKINTEVYPWWLDDGTEITVEENHYLFKMTYTDTGSTSKFDLDLADPQIRFKKTANGFEQVGDAFMGLVKAEGEDEALSFSGFADSRLSFATVTEKPVAVPDGVKTESWVFECGNKQATFADVAFDGNDVYLTNFISDFPAATIKGTVADDKVVFADGQFLGAYNRYDHFSYFRPATFDGSTDDFGETIYTLAATLEFTYNSEAKTLKAANNGAIYITTSPTTMIGLAAFDSPALRWQDETSPMTPGTPYVDYYESYDGMGFGGISFALEANSTDGRLLKTSNYFYNFIIDDEVMVLYPDEYTDLESEMTDIPYDYEDTYIYYWGDVWEAVIFRQGFESIGVRAGYRNADGTVTYSETAYAPGYESTGVGSVEAAAIPVQIEYFDLAGRRVENAANGMYIRRTIFSDGSVRSSKVIKK